MALKEKKNFIRVDFQIRIPFVRVVQDGRQLGVLSTDRARKIAQEAGLNLVEIAPTAKPPVCHIMDYDKYRYEKELREKEQRKKQKSVEMKELRFGSNIDDHDIDVKVKAATKFLLSGRKVKLNLLYKNREIVHKEKGFIVFNKIIDLLKEIAEVESRPRLEGKRLICIITPKVES